MYVGLKVGETVGTLIVGPEGEGKKEGDSVSGLAKVGVIEGTEVG